MKKILISALLIWNLIVFLIYGIDKRKAVKERWRIPEKTLLLMAYLFGGIGAYIGMRTFHHKTLDKKFRLVPIVAVIEIILLAYL